MRTFYLETHWRLQLRGRDLIYTKSTITTIAMKMGMVIMMCMLRAMTTT